MDGRDWLVVYYAAEWVVRAGALAVVPQRRPPASAAAWLLLFFFLPAAGLVLFLAIGSPRFPSWRKARFAALAPALREVVRSLRAAEVPREFAQRDVAGLAERLGGFPATGGNTVELIDDYDAVVERLAADISAARSHVLVTVYLFADDAAGRRVADAMAAAVLRGVTVRVLLDPVGSRRWRRGTLKILGAAGVEVRESLPFRWLRGRTRRDMRNHRKLFAVDGAVAYVGSQNLVAKDFRKGVVNRELVARVTGPVVAAVDAAIRADWFMETGAPIETPPAPPAPTGPAVVQLLPSGADYSIAGFKALLVWQMHRASRRIVLATPYFIPDEDVLAAMRTAAARGVVVDLVVSAVADQRLVHLAQCSYYESLLAAGVRVHLFRGFLLHAKNVGIDGRFAIVGSSNVDLRSFQLNEEASLLLYDEASVAAVGRIQDGYIRDSDALALAAWRKRPRLQRFAENLARLVSALL